MRAGLMDPSPDDVVDKLFSTNGIPHDPRTDPCAAQ
jgi:hypothetical protein